MIRISNEGAEEGLYNFSESPCSGPPRIGTDTQKRGGSSHAGPDPWNQRLETSGVEARKKSEGKGQKEKKDLKMVWVEEGESWWTPMRVDVTLELCFKVETGAFTRRARNEVGT